MLLVLTGNRFTYGPWTYIYNIIHSDTEEDISLTLLIK